MKIIFYELKKIFTPTILLIILLFSGVNIYKIVEIDKLTGFDGEILEGYAQIYDKVKGEKTKDKIDFVLQYNNKLDEIIINKEYNDKPSDIYYTSYPMGDSVVLKSMIIPEMQYAYNYEIISKQIVDKAAITKESYIEKGDIYSAKTYDKIINIYSDREIPFYSQTNGFEKFFTYGFSDFLSLILICFTLSTIFSTEKQNNTYNLVNTTVNRGKRIIIKKIITANIFVFLIVSFFYLISFSTIKIIFNMDYFNNPIWAIEYFAASPCKLTIIGAIIVNYTFKLVGYSVITGLVLVTSYYSKKNIFSVIINIFLVLVCLFLHENNILSYLNPISLIYNCEILKTYQPIWIYLSVAGLMLVITTKLMLLKGNNYLKDNSYENI